MDFHWAIEQLNAGNKVTNPRYKTRNGRYWIANNKIIYMSNILDNPCTNSFSPSDLFATDWQLYEDNGQDSREVAKSETLTGLGSHDGTHSLLSESNYPDTIIDIPIITTADKLDRIQKLKAKCSQDIIKILQDTSTRADRKGRSK